MITPNFVSQMILQELNKLGNKTLPYPNYFEDHSPIDYYFFNHLFIFLQE